MKIYTKIIDNKTKECLVINQEEAKLLNFEEMEVEFAFDGKAYLKGFKPEKSLEQLKAEKIKELKNNCMNYIYSVYPVYKQLDIINPLNDYPIERKEAMNIFIDENRNICKEKEKLIKKAKNQKELEEIDIEF